MNDGSFSSAGDDDGFMIMMESRPDLPYGLLEKCHKTPRAVGVPKLQSEDIFLFFFRDTVFSSNKTWFSPEFGAKLPNFSVKIVKC